MGSLQISNINPELLPQTLRDLVDLIGLEPALNLATHYSGVSVYIPQNPHSGHPLVAIVGLENLQKLSEMYAQEYIKLPNTCAYKLKHQMVRDLSDQGASIRNIARETGYTSRRVEQLKREFREEKQPDLFE